MVGHYLEHFPALLQQSGIFCDLFSDGIALQSTSGYYDFKDLCAINDFIKLWHSFPLNESIYLIKNPLEIPARPPMFYHV